MWPFKSKQSSDSSYTDQVIENGVLQASQPATSKLVAAQRGVMNVYGDKLAQCSYTGPQQITKKHLLEIGRDIPRYGCSRLVIVPEGNSFKLVRPIRADKLTREGWQVTLREGFKDRTLNLLDSEVINFVFNSDPEYPWRGVPLWESVTSYLAAEIDRVMADESKAGAGKFLWINGSPYADAEAMVKIKKRFSAAFSSLVKSRGELKVLFNPTGGGQHMEQPNTTVRIGPDWPDSIERTRAQLAREICASCNVAPEMLFGGPAGTVRESNRQFVQVMQSVCDVLADTLAESLNQSVMLNADTIYKTDLISRSRALGSMVKAGISLEEAKRIAGLE